MEQQLSLNQHHLLTPGVLTSLQVLAKPLPELASWLETHIEGNPLLSLDPSPPLDFDSEVELPSEENENAHATGRINSDNRHRLRRRIIENVAIVEQRDLYTLLSIQAKEIFSNPSQYKEALHLIHQMDKNGFLPSTIKDSPILEILQTFDPPGVAARCIQETLLLQLKRKHSNSIILKIVNDHYDDLLHQRIHKLSKIFKINRRSLCILLQKELVSLSCTPGDIGSKDLVVPWIPDLSILEENGQFKVKIHHTLLPRFFLNHRYNCPSNDKETKSYLLQKRKEAGIILGALRKRRITLHRLGNFLIKTQKAFFLGKTPHICTLSIQKTASFLKVHRSTVGRAIAEKVVNTPCGMLRMEVFFRHAQAIPNRMEIAIKQLIETEDKIDPLSDAEIVEKLGQAGFSCSRRTVAKYRNKMRLPKTNLRKR